MGDGFKDGPKGEAERFTKGGTEYHRSADNRNISGSMPEATAERLAERDVQEGRFVPTGTAEEAPRRLADRDVTAKQEHPDHPAASAEATAARLKERGVKHDRPERRLGRGSR